MVARRIIGLVAAAVLAAATAACGDDSGGGDGGPPDAWVGRDAVAVDARPGAPDAPAPDSAPADAAAPDADPSLLPDLVPEAITRDTGYRVTYCNRGPGSAAGSFRVRIASLSTGTSFDTPAAFAVPDPDSCAVTGAITCGLIGDPSCDQSGTVVAFVDPDDAIAEANEANNSLGVDF